MKTIFYPLNTHNEDGTINLDTNKDGILDSEQPELYSDRDVLSLNAPEDVYIKVYAVDVSNGEILLDDTMVSDTEYLGGARDLNTESATYAIVKNITL